MIKQEDLNRFRRFSAPRPARQVVVSRTSSSPAPRPRPVEAPIASVTPEVTSSRRLPPKKSLMVAGLACLLVVAGVGSFSLLRAKGSTVTVDPIPPTLASQVDFPPYYPTKLPSGFHLNKQSFNIPQNNVIVFNLVDSKNQKIYVSEEARPATFNFGGYYDGFADKQLTVVSSGTIATGRINGGATEIASLATSKTWLLVNTNSNVPLAQLRDMLNSLLVSH